MLRRYPADAEAHASVGDFDQVPVDRLRLPRPRRGYSRRGLRGGDLCTTSVATTSVCFARRYARAPEPLEDLEQVASLALIKAIDAFDAERGTAFSSYAVPCIAGALKRHFRDICWAVRPPRELQELALLVTRINEELSAATGAAPTAAQIAEHAGVDVEAILEAREAARALHSDSLDRPQREGDGRDGDSVVDTLGVPDTELDRVVDRVTLDVLLDELGEREQTIVRLYYQRELTQSEIGEQLGYSQMHISRLLRRAISRLEAATEDQHPDHRSAA